MHILDDFFKNISKEYSVAISNNILEIFQKSEINKQGKYKLFLLKIFLKSENTNVILKTFQLLILRFNETA